VPLLLSDSLYVTVPTHQFDIMQKSYFTYDTVLRSLLSGKELISTLRFAKSIPSFILQIRKANIS
jgi:hypothetical protein